MELQPDFHYIDWGDDETDNKAREGSCKHRHGRRDFIRGGDKTFGHL